MGHIRYIALILYSGILIVYERFWNALWLPLSLIAFQLSLFLTEIDFLFGTRPRLGFHMLMTAAALILTVRQVKALYRLRVQDILRRMEQDSDLAHRPPYIVSGSTRRRAG